ncbi:hypothetical protein RSAG8_12348, partial [Rhizoctonia solani AG-8 WAC10335]
MDRVTLITQIGPQPWSDQPTQPELLNALRIGKSRIEYVYSTHIKRFLNSRLIRVLNLTSRVSLVRPSSDCNLSVISSTSGEMASHIRWRCRLPQPWALTAPKYAFPFLSSPILISPSRLSVTNPNKVVKPVLAKKKKN